jgi:hypothetical protein
MNKRVQVNVLSSDWQGAMAYLPLIFAGTSHPKRLSICLQTSRMSIKLASANNSFDEQLA